MRRTRGDDSDDVILQSGEAAAGVAGHVFDENFVRRRTAHRTASGAIDDDAPVDATEQTIGGEMDGVADKLVIRPPVGTAAQMHPGIVVNIAFVRDNGRAKEAVAHEIRVGV